MGLVFDSFLRLKQGLMFKTKLPFLSVSQNRKYPYTINR